MIGSRIRHWSRAISRGRTISSLKLQRRAVPAGDDSGECTFDWTTRTMLRTLCINNSSAKKFDDLRACVYLYTPARDPIAYRLSFIITVLYPFVD